MGTAAELARLLRKERDRRGLSQGAAAAMSGVDQRRISAYERGDRVPRLDQVDQLLAAFGLQLRLSTEALFADVDAEIDALAAIPLPERLDRCRVHIVRILEWFAPAEPIIDGMAAAFLQGAPVPVTRLDMCVRADRLLDAAKAMARFPPLRWNEREQLFTYGEDWDPRVEGPMWWRSHLGQFAITVVDEDPAALTLVIEEQTFVVRPLGDIAVADPEVARVLDRARQRLRRPAA